MSVKYILYNPLSCNGKGTELAQKLTEIYKDDELKYCNMTQISGYGTFFDSISPESDIVLCGGDGTLNRFINDSDGYPYENPLYYYGTGSGNDFLRDLGKEQGCEPVRINEYVRNLPIVTVNGKSSRFINAIGYGIDGYCCETGDELREKSDKPINYTSIAVKGLLFHFRPANAVINVDGREYSYKKVWLAPNERQVLRRRYDDRSATGQKQSRREAVGCCDARQWEAENAYGVPFNLQGGAYQPYRDGRGTDRKGNHSAV